MFRKLEYSKSYHGFTIIEVLVVLVLVGLLAAVVAPNVFGWINSSKNSAVDKEVKGLIASLPLRAKITNTAIYLTSEQSLGPLPPELGKFSLMFEPELVVMSNGFCKGTELSLIDGRNIYRKYRIDAPYCKAHLIDG